MNCSDQNTPLVIGTTYHKIFQFFKPDGNGDYVAMDLSLYGIDYTLKYVSRTQYEQSSGFNITDNEIVIKIDPELTDDFQPVTYSEVFIFTLLSDTTEVRCEYDGTLKVIKV